MKTKRSAAVSVPALRLLKAAGEKGLLSSDIAKALDRSTTHVSDIMAGMVMDRLVESHVHPGVRSPMRRRWYAAGMKPAAAPPRDLPDSWATVKKQQRPMPAFTSIASVKKIKITRAKPTPDRWAVVVPAGGGQITRDREERIAAERASRG